MSYNLALAAAGAKVLAYETFGDYQGTWMALVEYKDKKGIVEGSYGSCSGCDAFQGEFGYDEPEERDGRYYGRNWEEITKEEFDIQNADYQKKLAAFGESYLTTIQDKDDIENRVNNLVKDDWFSVEEKEGLEWALKQLTEN